MLPFNIILFGSGKGSLIESICIASQVGILQVNIKKIFSNSFNSDIRSIGSKYNICVQEFNWDKSVMDRSEFDSTILDNIPEDIDLLVFAGWDHIVTEKFIDASPRIINIHPSLPNQFIGLNCIKKAYDAFQQGKINYTGSMVHNVSKDLDRGEVINSIFVPILPGDTYDDLETRQKSLEKGLLISSIYSIADEARKNTCLKKDVYVGKVRSVENIGYGLLLMTASDRLSSFDKHICDIHNKGTVLNKMSSWWFHETKHIIDNHFLYINGKYMIVKKTQPIKLEFVVRGYMTGSTKTSIWPMYKNGQRNMYGIQFREGYVKNEKLDEIILTPTTKGASDKPITEEEIISENYLTKEEFDFIKERSFKLFSFGQKKAQERGLILVDTKYEFGKLDDKIILIDELHTCDSSRYWLQDSYEECINSGSEPLKKDKDVIRDWVKKQCDPYKDEIPVIPFDLIEKVTAVYDEYIDLFK